MCHPRLLCLSRSLFIFILLFCSCVTGLNSPWAASVALLSLRRCWKEASIILCADPLKKSHSKKKEKERENERVLHVGARLLFPACRRKQAEGKCESGLGLFPAEWLSIRRWIWPRSLQTAQVDLPSFRFLRDLRQPFSSDDAKSLCSHLVWSGPSLLLGICCDHVWKM